MHKLAGGTNSAPYSLTARTAAVPATGTVTLTSTGGAANDTVSINGVALTAKQHNATGTCTVDVSACDNGDTVTINGYAFTCGAAQDLTTGTFNIASTDAAGNASLAACINASTDPLIAGIVTATASATVTTIRAVTAGTAGNSLTFVSDDADGLAVSGAGTLTNGAAPAAGEWECTGSLTQQATSFAAAVNASTNALLLNLVTATSLVGVATITASVPGVAGNTMTLAKSGTNIAVSGTGRLTGGTETVITLSY